ncbi:MAG TPA: VCBS repeat-containing protein [Candidatus Competibacter sp.]|nr:VCBS repeat-containing protein [Candidatus Competibacter sp.]
MKIAGSTVQMTSQHAAITQREVKESLRVWIGDQRPDFEGQRQPSARRRSQADTVQLSQAARDVQCCKQSVSADVELRPDDEHKLELIVRMVEMLTGKKIKLITPKELGQELDAALEQVPETTEALPSASATGQTPPQRAGFGIEYDYSERHYEAERTTFSAEGVIKTQDGREIAFSVDLGMSREFLREQSVSLRAGDAKLKDPLVLNFGGDAVELTTTRFSFDIDADGNRDQIAFVGPNSGFLALDRNGDGVINDGRELFGPTTGQGFAELAAYDDDGNQWIDENDAIYQNLRIWSKDAEGRDQLVALGQRGVGAIYLGHVTTPFSLKDSQNTLLGQIRESGIFVQENGVVGSTQQIDLTA